MRHRTYLFNGTALTFIFPERTANELDPHTGEPLDPRPRPTPMVFAPGAEIEPVARWGGGSADHFQMIRDTRRKS